jgi:hypothetical protein
MKGLQTDHEIYDSAQMIPADTFLLSNQYKNFNIYRQLRDEMKEGKDIDPQALVDANPQYYHSYVLAGDYCFKKKDYPSAKKYYEAALTKVIATKGEEDHIRKQLELCNTKSGN